MFTWIRQNFSAILSASCGLGLLFGTGVVFGYKHWPPTPLINTADQAFKDLAANGDAYYFGVPSKHLRPRRFPKDGVNALNAEKMAPGVTFMTGLFGNRLTARLYSADGTLLHEWTLDFFKLAPEAMSYPFDALIHGDHLFESGDIVANLDGKKLLRISACGEIVWQKKR